MRYAQPLRATLCLLSATLSLGAARPLLGAVQGIASLADREVEYAWDTPPIDDVADDLRESVQRLSGITYPSARAVGVDYGSGGSIDDRLNRVRSILYDSSDAITYRYMGTGRQVGQELGNGVGFDYDAGTANSPVSKLDRFGRILDIEWTDGTPKLQYQYGYDAAGNRKFVRTGYQLANQDWLYQYDALNRLVRASRGTLNGPGDGFTGLGVTDVWSLDALGNWSAGSGDVSFREFLEPSGFVNGVFDAGTDTTVLTDHHETDQVNRIGQRIRGDYGGTDPGVRLGYDQAGNLVFDGQHFYRYDAFNRVVEVRYPGTVQVYPSGELTGTPGDVWATFYYDALGRRVRTGTWSGNNTRHVYGSGAEVLAEYEFSGSYEVALREFVWGTGGFPDPVVMVDATGADGSAGIDPYYYVKDALGSVGALTDASGAVVERYLYSPYGQTTIHAPGGSYRNYSYYGNPFAWTAQRYDAGNKLYHFWARTYSPELGRFLQEDEQGLLAAVGVSLPDQGEAPGVSAPTTGAGDEYADALNLFLYVGANPTNLRDPLGLSGWDDEVDDLISDITGQRMYALGAINEGAKWASIGLNTALSIAWGLLPGSGLYDAFQSVIVIRNGKGGFWEAMDIATAAFPVAKFATKGAGKLLGLRSLFKAKKFGAIACNCFVAGMEVDTPEGPVPIEELDVGDEVMTRDQNQPDEPARVGRVTRVFRDLAPVILWLTLANGQALGVTSGHEVWTHQDGWTSAGELEPGDTFADAEGCPVAVLGVTRDPTPTPVYNLEVDGSFTYFAGGVWVHNNSCTAIARAYRAFTAGEFRHNLIVRTGFDAGDAFQAHHVFPQKYESFFQALGVKINDPKWGAWFDKSMHQGKSSAIGTEWDRFFQGNVSYDGALQLARDQAAKFGFIVDF